MQKNQRRFFLILALLATVALTACTKAAMENRNLGLDELQEIPATGELQPLTGDVVRAEPTGKTGTNLGDYAPNFKLKKYDGTEVRLSDYQGKPVVLYFFASWCPYCNNEMPRMNKLITSQFNNEVHMIAIDAAGEDAATVQQFAQKHGFTFPILVDEDQSIKTLYSVTGHPYSMYIDAQGIVQDKRYGASLDTDIANRINKIAS